MFKPVLMQMQPRMMVAPIESVKQNVNIPRVWFRAFTEPQVCDQMNKFVQNSDYTHYLISSDDLIVWKRAIDNVLMNAPNYDVYTGWLNMHFVENKMSSISNVCYGLFNTLQGNWPERSDYPPWETINDVLSNMFIRQTSLASFAISCFKKQVLLDYPLQTYSKPVSSDHNISYRIQRGAKYTIWTHRDAFCRHLRQGWGPLRHQWLVGNQKPEIIYELEPKQYQYNGKRDYDYEPLFSYNNRYPYTPRLL
tara:strand:- start:183 stop:935 length:753 start_codon:yes stop_codon:yes gene_type:complete